MHYKHLYQTVSQILWQDWDPIGVHDIAPKDEYEGYVAEIARMLQQRYTQQEIARKLYTFETENMGLIGNMEHCLEVAKKLIKEAVI